MLRSAVKAVSSGQRYLFKNATPAVMTTIVREKTSHDIVIDTIGRHHGFYHEPDYDEKFMKKFVTFFDREDIDSWEIRRALTDLHGYDCIPEPYVIESILKACRRLNDYALAVRYLESLKFKCAIHVKVIWPWLLQELEPTLKELGIDTPEQLGYDKPELALQEVLDIH